MNVVLHKVTSRLQRNTQLFPNYGTHKVASLVSFVLFCCLVTSGATLKKLHICFSLFIVWRKAWKWELPYAKHVRICAIFFVTVLQALTFWSLLVKRCTNSLNIQQPYALPTLDLCVLFISERTATCTPYNTNWSVSNRDKKCLLRGSGWVFKTAVPNSKFRWKYIRNNIIKRGSLNSK
jgi:hypothetical protein